MPPNPRLYGLLGGLYVAGFAATLAVLARAQQLYVPFDASHLLFVHYRLPDAPKLADLFAATSLVWFGAFVALAVLILRTSPSLTRGRLVAVIALQALLGSAFVALPIAIDSDQFAYIAYAHAAQTGSPYEPQRLEAAAPEPDRQIALHWGNPLPPDRYGGGWTLFNSLLLSPVATKPPYVQALVLRIAALLAACAVTFLVATILPRAVLTAPIAFALNPLVLLETANGSHNEIYVVLAGCACANALVRERYGLAGLLLGTAAAIKFTYLPFVAPLIAYAYHRTRSALQAAAPFFGTLAVVAICSAPFGWRQGALQAPLGLMGSEHGLFARIAPIASLGAAVAILAMTIEAARARLSPWLLVVTALFLLSIAGKLEAWYPLITAPLLVVPSTVTRCGFLAFSALGLVMAQSSLIGGFPLVEGYAAAIAVAAVCVAVLAPRVHRARKESEASA